MRDLRAADDVVHPDRLAKPLLVELGEARLQQVVQRLAALRAQFPVLGRPPPPSDARRGVLPLVLAPGAGGGGLPAVLARLARHAPGPASRPMIDQRNVRTPGPEGLTRRGALRCNLCFPRFSRICRKQVFYRKVGCAPFIDDEAPVMVDNDYGSPQVAQDATPGCRRQPRVAGQLRPTARWRSRWSAACCTTSRAQPRAGDASTSGGTVHTAAAFHQIVLPDLAVIEAGGISDASLARIGAIHGVRQTLALDGAKVTSGGAQVNVIGVNAQQFRLVDPAEARRPTSNCGPRWTPAASSPPRPGPPPAGPAQGRQLLVHRHRHRQPASSPGPRRSASRASTWW